MGEGGGKKERVKKGRWAYVEFLIITRQKIPRRGSGNEQITWTLSRFVCSRPAFSTNFVLYTRICIYIHITCTYTAPSVRLVVAIAAFQTRHGIDVPDASKVGRKKKRKKERKRRKKRNS